MAVCRSPAHLHPVPQSTTFRVLDLFRNSVGKEGAVALALAIRQTRHFSRLDLCKNPIAGGGKALQVAKGANQRVLIEWDTEQGS